MENVKSLFTRNILTKLETNEKLMANGKAAKYVISVPEFEFSSKGEVLGINNIYSITTKKQAEAYDKKYAKVMDIIKEKYPDISIVRRIFTASLKEAISELSGNWADTTSGKILRGKITSNARVFQNMYGTDPVNTVAGFLNTLKTYDGKEVVLPKVKKTKASIMKQFSKNPVGYYIPEITAKGLVVKPLVGSGNTAFDVNCHAFNSNDVTKEQIIEYFKAPFGNAKVDVDFDRIVEFSQAAYSSIDTEEFLPKVKLLVDYITANYPLSFEKIKKDKIQENPVVRENIPAQKPVNEQLKKKVDALFETPLMLPEATVQTLVDETRTRITNDDAKNMDEKRRMLISLIHQKVRNEKDRQEKENKTDKMPRGVEVVDFEESVYEDGMPEFDVDKLKEELNQQNSQEEVTPVQEEKEPETVVVAETGDKSHITLIFNNNYFFGTVPVQEEKAEESIFPMKRKQSKVKRINGESAWTSNVDNLKEKE